MQNYAQKKNLCKCVECKKYKAIRKGKRRGKERFFCLVCGVRFEKKDKQDKTIDSRQILADHLNRNSYRMLSQKYDIGRTRVCGLVNDELKVLPKNWELTKKLIDPSKYSGKLVVDGKYIPIKEKTSLNLPLELRPWLGKRNKIPRSAKRQSGKRGKTMIWGIDYESHDLPHYELGDGENCLVINDYFRKLKELEYPLIVLIIDDKAELKGPAKRYYPNVIIQLCTRHYNSKIGRELKTNSIKAKIRSLERKLDKLFILDSDYIPSSRKWSQRMAIKLINEIMELSFRNELILDFEKIVLSIINAKDYETAQIETKYLLEIFWPQMSRQMRRQLAKDQIKKVSKLITDFKDKKEDLISYLKYPHLNIPKTNNMIEGCNSQIELGLASIRGFEVIINADNYLNAWIIKRRLTPFTDCRKGFKKLNGKSPLECAGVASSVIEKLKINDLIKQKK